MLGGLFGYFEKRPFLSKNYYWYVLGNFWKNWATFYSNVFVTLPTD